MREDGNYGDRSERIRPELMARVREVGERNAKDLGLTMEEYLGMCEDAACNEHRELPIRPELMAKVREIGERNARDRGLTMEEYLDANKLVAPKKRSPSWLESILLKLGILKPSL